MAEEERRKSHTGRDLDGSGGYFILQGSHRHAGLIQGIPLGPLTLSLTLPSPLASLLLACPFPSLAHPVLPPPPEAEEEVRDRTK